MDDTSYIGVIVSKRHFNVNVNLLKVKKKFFFRQQLVAATWVFRQGVTAGRSISDTDPSIGSGCGGRHYSAIFQRGTMGVVSGWSGRVSPPLCLHLWLLVGDARTTHNVTSIPHHQLALSSFWRSVNKVSTTCKS